MKNLFALVVVGMEFYTRVVIDLGNTIASEKVLVTATALRNEVMEAVVASGIIEAGKGADEALKEAAKKMEKLSINLGFAKEKKVRKAA